jgi:transposase-like protein
MGIKSFGIIPLQTLPHMICSYHHTLEPGALITELNLSLVTSITEEDAREYAESVLWPEGPICPHCGGKKSWEIKGGSVRSGLYKCSGRHKQFTVTVGTIMHGSHISIRQLVIDFHLMTGNSQMFIRR